MASEPRLLIIGESVASKMHRESSKFHDADELEEGDVVLFNLKRYVVDYVNSSILNNETPGPRSYHLRNNGDIISVYDRDTIICINPQWSYC
jgi:hypothetical protein